MRLSPLFLIVASIPVVSHAADMSLRRVMLSSGGVGYFEYEGQAIGSVDLGLPVRLDQVDDVLKSFVVLDAAGGVGSVQLPGADDPRSNFGAVPFGPEAFESALSFVNALRGVEVLVDGPKKLRGVVVRAEVAAVAPARPGEAARTVTRVSLLTPNGLSQFVLEDAVSVQVADADLRAKLARAMAAARPDVAQGSRLLTVRSVGEGARTVRAGFVAGYPLWKASYRLVMPASDAPDGKVRLQGWATFENRTGGDWSNVSLSFQYGNPVTFRQALYRSYYVDRPEVPVEVLGRIFPDLDQRAYEPPPPPAAPIMAPAPVARQRAVGGGLLGAGAGAAVGLAEGTSFDASMSQPAERAAVDEGATQTVFLLPNPIDLASGHSASVPIVDVALPGTRVFLAKPDERHPVASVRVTNDSKAGLPAGVLTIYDPQRPSAYAGDARLAGLPPGESRLVPFAQDLATSLEWTRTAPTTVSAVSVARGVVKVDRRIRTVTRLRVVAPAASARRVLVELPKGQGLSLADGFAKPVEETASAWRMAVEAPAGGVGEASFGFERHEVRSVRIGDDPSVLAVLRNANGASPEAVAAVDAVAALKAKESALVEERQATQRHLTQIEKDQERLRANLGALQSGDALRTRVLDMLDASETDHAQAQAAFADVSAKVDAAHKAFADAVAALAF